MNEEKMRTFRSIKLQAVSFRVFRLSSETSMLTQSLTRPHCIRKPISPGIFKIGGSILIENDDNNQISKYKR